MNPPPKPPAPKPWRDPNPVVIDWMKPTLLETAALFLKGKK